MLLGTRKLYRNELFWDVDVDDCDKGFLCKDKLLEVFDVPDAAQVIWVEVHDRPGVDRVKVERPTDNNDDEGPAYFVRVDGDEYGLSGGTAEILLRIMGRRRIVHVGIKYR